MNVVTSVTVFQDAVGMRMSITYSQVNEETGKIVGDNMRIDRVITNANIKNSANSMLDYAQQFVDSTNI